MDLYIAGINGMVGSALALESRRRGIEVFGKSSSELDLTNRKSVFNEINHFKPNTLVIAAAKVGGIGSNSSFPVDFLSRNIQIQTNLLDAAHAANVPRVLFLGSSCIYPKFAPQPIEESSLLTGELEPTNEPYAVAKIAGLKLVQAYRQQFEHKWISAMPTNLYGPRDNFHLDEAHVLPALINRFHKAKIEDAEVVNIWGDGTPLREFLHVDDLARACLMLIEKYDDSAAINIGSGHEVSIKNLALLISKVVGFNGKIAFDIQRPNGTPRKFLDSSRISKLGWAPTVELEHGIIDTYKWFIENYKLESEL